MHVSYSHKFQNYDYDFDCDSYTEKNEQKPDLRASLSSREKEESMTQSRK